MELTIGSSPSSFDFATGSAIQKLYSNGANKKRVEYDDGIHYDFIYEDDRNDFSNYIRYQDLGKKQYNYDSKYYKNYYGHNGDNADELVCKSTTFTIAKEERCEYQYKKPEESTTHKYLYDRWLTALILACCSLLTNLGLACFGLLLFTNCGANADL